MIRPISLFLLVCLSLSEVSASTVTEGFSAWVIILLCAVPAITLIVAPKVRQSKFGIDILAFTILIAWGIALFLFGWMEYVREYVGNYIVNDEVLILLPPILSLALLWWITSPIDRKLAWVSHRLSVDVLLLLVPILLVWGVGEATDLYAQPESLLQNAEIAAIICLFLLSPLYIRLILHAKELKDSALKDAITIVGHRAGIRTPKVYIWHTHLLLMNAFAIGILFAPKTIILTDKLVQNLTKSELLAVVRHEFAHHRYWHLPFLFLSMICTLVWSDHACDWLQLDVNSGYVQISQLVLMILSFILLSTQFEKQADAYAAVDYSKSVGQEVITPEAVENLSLALSAIADTNQIPIDRGDLLHGSIQQRQKNLEDLVGCPLDNIPINQRVNKIKIALVVLIFLGIVV